MTARQIEDDVVIREITPPDAAAAAHLSAELGYPAAEEEVRDRIVSLKCSENSVVYVACTATEVVGWIEAAIAVHLATGAHGEIRGLVVADKHRCKGIGRLLVAAAERWVAARGVSTMLVRSRTTRGDAHRFYLREGYSIVKTSAVFSKQVTG